MNRFLLMLLLTINVTILNASDTTRMLDNFAQEMAGPFQANSDTTLAVPLLTDDDRFDEPGVTVDALRERLNSKFNLTIERRENGMFYVIRSPKSREKRLAEYFNQRNETRDNMGECIGLLFSRIHSKPEKVPAVQMPVAKKRKFNN